MGWIADLLKEIPSAARYKSELEAMEKENAFLKSLVADLRQEIQRRDNEVQKEKSHSDHLEEVKEKILALLASQDAFENNVVQTLGISAQVAKFHLQDLSEMEFIYRSLSMTGQQFPWKLAQEGRRYLAKHGLLA